MLQIAFIRENQEKVIQALAKGIWTQKYCGRCHKLDTERRATQVRRYFS
jgi:seryl-tRNA synthetase